MRDKKASETVDEQASRWVVQLSNGNCSDSQQAEFQAWYAAASSHADAFDRLQALWGRMGQVPRQRLRRSSRRAVVALFAGVTLASLGVLSGSGDAFPSPDYDSGNAVRSIDLEDGTRVTLDAGSAIEVRLTNGRRNVRLLNGRAFFDVRKSALDYGAPFEVTAGRVLATAIGTRFEIQHDGRSTQIAVQEHNVAVRCDRCRPMVDQLVASGQQLTVDDDHHTAVALVSNISSASHDWMVGKMSFNDVLLSETVAQLGRHTRSRIVLASAAARRLRVSGAVVTADVPKALRVLLAQSDLNLRVMPGVIVIY